MNRHINKTVLVLAALVWATGCQPPAREAAPLSTEDVAAIKANLEALVKAGLASDWDSFFGQFTEDAVWMASRDLPAVEGLPAMKEGDWVQALESELLPVDIDGRGDLAFARGTFSLLLDYEGAVKHEGKFVTIHRKQSDEAWCIAVYISSD